MKTSSEPKKLGSEKSEAAYSFHSHHDLIVEFIRFFYLSLYCLLEFLFDISYRIPFLAIIDLPFACYRSPSYSAVFSPQICKSCSN